MPKERIGLVLVTTIALILIGGDLYIAMNHGQHNSYLSALGKLLLIGALVWNMRSRARARKGAVV